MSNLRETECGHGTMRGGGPWGLDWSASVVLIYTNYLNEDIICKTAPFYNDIELLENADWELLNNLDII